MLAPCSKGTSGGHCSIFRGTMDPAYFVQAAGSLEVSDHTQWPAWQQDAVTRGSGGWVFPCCSQQAREYMLNYKTCTLKKKKKVAMLSCICSFYLFIYLFFDSIKDGLYFNHYLIKIQVHTATAKSLQSCPTLCDPVPRILQARTLEWVAISFSSA